MYKGIVPCADCEGIETILNLRDESNFVLTTHYLGKKDSKINVLKGTYTWNKEGNTVVLSGIENGPSQYFVSENYLTQLDLEGNKITGDLASKYVLEKQNETAAEIVPPPPPTKGNFNQSPTSTSVQKQVQNKIQEATFFIESPIPAVTLTVKEGKLPYHIMAGAFRDEKNAQRVFEDLSEKGYKAKRIERNKHGLYPVLYGSFTTYTEAEKLKNEIREKENPQAWILIESL